MTATESVIRCLLAAPNRWLNSAEAGSRVEPLAPDATLAASRARRDEKIFALWDGERFHYPAFQFEPKGGPRTDTTRLIEVLPRDRDGSVGNDAALWVFAPDLALEERCPADVFPLDPERVIALARRRRDGDPDCD